MLLIRRKAQGGIPPHDRVWCLVDRDEHHTLAQAIHQAGRHGIDLAVSTPSFELWLPFHYNDQHAYLNDEAGGAEAARVPAALRQESRDRLSARRT
ncbi:RloB family protein [Actinoalloteichus hymeniacidonis]|uniref:RloB family protein n=1 Tax=Actinoalloteichus hymeniacidonis TaxID=340345 RepID=UPI0035D52AF2